MSRIVDGYTGETMQDYRDALARVRQWQDEAMEKGWTLLFVQLQHIVSEFETRLHELGDPEHPYGGIQFVPVEDIEGI